MKPTWLQNVPHSVWKHDYADYHEIPECYEFEFPVPAFLSEHYPEARFVFGKNKSEILRELQLSYQGKIDASTEELINTVLSMYCEAKLVLCESKWFLRLVSPETEERFMDHIFIHLATFRKYLESHPNDPLSATLGFREGYPSDSGFFVGAETNFEDFFVPEEITESDYWNDSVPVFCTDSGEVVVVKPDGKVGWNRMAEHEMVSCPCSLHEFELAFLEHVTDSGWDYSNSTKRVRFPFDSHTTQLKLQ